MSYSAAAPELNVAIIGYGLAGAVFHAPLVAAEPRMRVAVVVTGSAERAQQARAEHPGVRVLPHADELFAQPRLADLVVVASPNSSHAPLAHAALRAGLPVVVDKPMTPTAAQAADLIAAARAAGLLLSVFQNRRWDGDYLTVRRLLDEGRLGEVTRFESRFERWRPTPKGGWRELGGADEAAGLLYDLGSHLVDQALDLFGPATVVHAETDGRRATVTSDDDTFIALLHDNAVRSHLWMSAVASDIGPRFRVLGTTAAYLKYGLDVQEDALREGSRPGDAGWGADEPERYGMLGTPGRSERIETEHGSYERYYAGIAAALLDRAPVPVDPADAVRSLSILETARRMAARD
ncbi:Gfo/Idh/MocA family oxidoreductase [Actinocrinis puniceicyclus]|uniref:Gfo/Idh/MocA family oxidoreductase n=1 Tax=Actinocrinis puniceicyclus TaxID=977794 RepID=A0A8J8BBF7_9ACTN|nr:Gfo/Idh/MocA family oxidoreductase [Actinocrinis puniceicyclus]MBS2963997.1 Gfo/Idh/MocA family oxidoreductase [Actinocrinis puniceicyclus]